MSGVRQGLDFLLLPMYTNFPKPLIEKLVFSSMSSLGTLVNYELTIYACIYFWALNPVLFVFMFVTTVIP